MYLNKVHGEPPFKKNTTMPQITNPIVPKRHSLHEVGMPQTSAQIVFTQSLSPEMGPDSVFGQAVRFSMPPGWLCSSQ